MIKKIHFNGTYEVEETPASQNFKSFHDCINKYELKSFLTKLMGLAFFAMKIFELPSMCSLS